MKRILGILIAVMMVVTLAATFVGAQQEITVKLNGENIDFADVKPQIINSRTMVPLRAIFEALGASVDWDDATKTVKSSKGDISIELTIGKNELKKNGKAVALDVPGQIVNSRTLVPVRAISEAYECEVNWEDKTKTVIITTPDGKKTEEKVVYTFDLNPNLLRCYNIDGPVLAGKVLKGKSTSVDPNMTYSNPIDVNIDNVTAIRINAKVPAGKMIQVFFSTEDNPVIDAEKLYTANTTTDDFATYTIDTSENKEWKGILREFRIDPVNATDMSFEIASVELVGLVSADDSPEASVQEAVQYGKDYVLPREDSFLITDALAMRGGGDFPLANGWLADNKTSELIGDGRVSANVMDSYTDEYNAVYRDFDAITSGNVIVEFRADMMSPDDGLYFGFADDKGNVNVKIRSDYGFFTLCGKKDVKTEIPFSKEELTDYAILLNVNLDKNEMYAYINGVLTEKVEIADGISLNRFVIGSTVEGKAYASPRLVRIYQNYASAERIIATDALTGKTPYGMNTSGDVRIAEYPWKTADSYSVKINALGGVDSYASKNFAKVTEKGVFESLVFLPKAVDGAYFTLTSGEDEAVKIYSKDGAWFVGDKKMRDFTENIWQILRVETDAKADKAVIKICGKNVGTVDLKADYIDGFKIGINPDINAIMWFDDFVAYNYIDHADYPSEPKANNDDGYNIGIHVCNLWHDASIAEGWQAVTAFDEFEPYMGYYDEGTPEVADWEIKMMAEHGIDFQNMVWYAGLSNDMRPIKAPVTSNYAIHDGYFNSKYGDYVKFCIMWENHAGGVNTRNLEEFKEYIWNYWKEYYFSDPRYMVIDNKPFITFWDYDNLVKSFGSPAGVKEAIAFMREDIKTLGFDDIIIVIPNRSDADAEALGVDGIYYYHFAQNGSSADYQIDVMNGRKNASLPVIPTLAIGHNGIGRYDYRTDIITLDGHKKVAEYIKNDYLVSEKKGTWADNLLFVSNWNEYSEGHYINPTNIYGYGFLENIKDVFTNDKSSHKNLDTGLTEAQKTRITKMYPDNHHSIRYHRNVTSQYNISDLKVDKSWSFANDDVYNTWKLISIETDEKTATGIKAHATSVDPVIESKTMKVDISSTPVIHIRMAAEKATLMDVFFKTLTNPEIEANVKHRRLQVDQAGKMVDYYIDMSDNPEWNGTLIGLRIDPVSNQMGFEIELIELLKTESKKASVVANGFEMDFNFDPILVDGDVQVTADARKGFFTRLNLYYVWNRHTKTLTLESKTKTLALTVGSDKATLDGKTVELGYTFDLFDGLPVIRLGKICELLGFDAKLEDDVMTIKSNNREGKVEKEYFGWDFDRDMDVEGWMESTATSSSVAGFLQLRNPSIPDVQVYSPNFNIYASDYERLTIGIRVKEPEKMKGQFFQIFYDANGASYTEANSLKAQWNDLSPKKDEVVEIEFDLTKQDGWKGSIIKLRVDPFNTFAECDIDYIRLYPSKDKQNGNVVSTAQFKEISRFEFDKAEDAAKLEPHNNTVKVEDGHLALVDPKNGDTGVLWSGANLNAGDVTAVKISLKSDFDAMAGKFLQLFFATDSSPLLDENKSIKVAYDVMDKKDGEPYEIIIDMTENKEWKGIINMIRFDPYNSQFNAYIDYIAYGILVK